MNVSDLIQINSLGERAYTLNINVDELSSQGRLHIQQKIWALAHSCKTMAGVEDIVPGMNNLSIILDHVQSSPNQISSMLQELWYASSEDEFDSQTRVVPVSYGEEYGPDIEFVASFHNLSVSQLIELHSEVLYTVFFIGFQPGFAYMGGLPDILHTPRRDHPRVLVPAGSVAIGGAQTGIYPYDSPGGWHIIGHTAVSLFDSSLKQPSFLRPGDLVRFQAVNDHV